MSNKTQLQANNDKLDALIARVNAAKNTAASLPEAGGGEDVTAETNEYTSLNTELEEVINSLPEAGGGGNGGSVKTCTVTIKILSDMCDPIGHYVRVANGNLSIFSAYGSAGGIVSGGGIEIFMQNVMCESMIFIEDEGWMLPTGLNIEGTAVPWENTSAKAFILAPTVEGENCTITFSGGPSGA